MACSSASDSATTNGNALSGVSRLSLSLRASGGTKAGSATRDAREIIVEIDGVRVRNARGGWTSISTEPVRVDLLRLREHAAELGVADLPPGRITEIRLHVREGSSPHVTTEDGHEAPLFVPSGEQSGIKIKCNIEVRECGDTALPLDFDLDDSIKIHSTGHRDEYIMRPVIRPGAAEEDDLEGCEPDDDADDDATTTTTTTTTRTTTTRTMTRTTTTTRTMTTDVRLA